MMRRFAPLLLLLVGVGFGAACSPRDRESVAPFVGPVVRATCILLRAFMKDGTTSEVCATAEDLAPLVSEIISEREERGEPPPTGPIVAFAMPPPKKLQAKRRCAAWVPVESSKDGGASFRDASSPAGRGGDGGR